MKYIEYVIWIKEKVISPEGPFKCYFSRSYVHISVMVSRFHQALALVFRHFQHLTLVAITFYLWAHSTCGS